MSEPSHSSARQSSSLLPPQSQSLQQPLPQQQQQQQRGARSQGSSGSSRGQGRRSDQSRNGGRAASHDPSGASASESLLQPPVFPFEYLRQGPMSPSSSAPSESVPVAQGQPFAGKVAKPRVPVWFPKSRPMAPVSLHQEIKYFYDHLKATAEEERMRKDLVTRLTTLVNKLWPTAKVTLYGSCLTGTCLPMSDVDLVVVVDTPYPPLQVLADALSRNFPCDAMDLLTTARVPLIKLRDSSSKLVVDISFNQTNGPRNSEVVLDLMKKYPEAKPLVFVLKYFLYFHGQNEVYLGGLGSYALTLMIVFFIQKHADMFRKVSTSDDQEGEIDLGLLLRGFLRFYGFDFDYENTGISVMDGGSTFSKKERGWYAADKPYLLALEDACDPENDVGKPAFNIPTVTMLFRQAYEQLVIPERYPHVSFLIRILDVSPQMPNVRRNLAAPFRSKKNKKKKPRDSKQTQTQNGENAAAASSNPPNPDSETKDKSTNTKNKTKASPASVVEAADPSASKSSVRTDDDGKTEPAPQKDDSASENNRSDEAPSGTSSGSSTPNTGSETISSSNGKDQS